MRKLGILGAVAVVLLVSAVLQFVQVRNLSDGDRSADRAAGALRDKIPGILSGWQGRDEPLGATEVARGKVEAILNFDDCVFKVFTRGDTHLGVYVAYWRKDRMPVSRVASHTPDRCWTENGWECRETRFNEIWTTPRGIRFQPGQRRLFNAPTNQPEHVIFWHLVNGRAFDFGERFTLFTHPGKWLRDTARYAALGSGEQYFIRLTSNRPFEELKSDKGWSELCAALANLGLTDTAGETLSR